MLCCTAGHHTSDVVIALRTMAVVHQGGARSARHSLRPQTNQSVALDYLTLAAAVAN